MQIALLVGVFPPRWLAGTEIATYNMARHLAKRGHGVHVITSLDECLPRESLEQGFHVHRVLWPRIRFVGLVFFWLRMLLLLKRMRPDVVHCQNIGMGIPGFLAKRFLSRPCVVWGQGSDVYQPWRFKKLLSRMVLKNADAVIALTCDMSKEMQRVWNREVLVVPNGIDLERFRDLHPEEVRTRLQANAGDRLIVFVGRFRPEKAIPHLIEALDIVRQQAPCARLVLVGEGPEEDGLRRLVQDLDLGDHVQFAGQAPNDEVPHYMAAADIFVLSSLSEGLPVTVLEALAAGAPVVATRVGGLPEVVVDGQNGFLVEPRSPEQLAGKILLLLGDDELRARISANNREKARAYSWESVVDRLEEVYRGLVNGEG